MESSTILTADVLDILFEGRNKDYGAYDLRRTYSKRLTVSITVMLSATCMLFIGFAFAGKKEATDPALKLQKMWCWNLQKHQRNQWNYLPHQ